MTCIACEIRRAKILAKLQRFVCWSLDDIAEFLTNTIGTQHYAKDQTIFRKSQLPPYHDYVILKPK
jgi:hypothetical protein